MGEYPCPECGSGHVMGHEVQGVYDGVLFWSCMTCGVAWSRDWTGYGSRRQQIADSLVAAHNAPSDEASGGESAL